MAPAASASTSAKASPAPAAAPKAKEAPVDPEELMKDASTADLEDEVTEGPAANWEVAVSLRYSIQSSLSSWTLPSRLDGNRVEQETRSLEQPPHRLGWDVLRCYEQY